MNNETDPRYLVYVAGKFSGKTRADVEANIAAAVTVSLEVAKLGVMPVCPHANTAHPDFEHAQPYQFWIAGTDELLRRCDALITVPGWEQSSGARGEVKVATEIDMPIFHSLADLASHLNGADHE